MNFTTHRSASNNRLFHWKPVVLLFIFILPVLSSRVYLQIERQQVRKSVKRAIIQGLPDEKLVILSFSRADSARAVSWKHSREFRYQGKMYDIVRTEVFGDSIRFICWKDTEESFLDKEILTLMDKAMGNQPQGKTASYQLYKYYSSLYFSIFSFDTPPAISNTIQRSSLRELYFEPWQPVSEPPPKSSLIA